MVLALALPPSSANGAFTPVGGGAASDAPGIGDIAAALNNAAGLIEDGAPTTETAQAFVAASVAATTTLPVDAGGPVRVDSDESSIAIGVPGDGSADGVAALGGVVYEGALADISVVAKATAQGAQVLSVLGSSESPTSLFFPVQASAGASLKLNPDGSVAVLESVGVGKARESVEVLRGAFSSPWAVDAIGNKVETQYEIRGMTLIQHVYPTESTVFPVTADPSFKVGWTGLLAHWTRGEAKWLTGLSLAATSAALATLCAGPHAVACIAAAGAIYYALDSASDSTVNWLYDNGYGLTTRLAPYISVYFEKRSNW